MLDEGIIEELVLCCVNRPCYELSPYVGLLVPTTLCQHGLNVLLFGFFYIFVQVLPKSKCAFLSPTLLNQFVKIQQAFMPISMSSKFHRHEGRYRIQNCMKRTPKILSTALRADEWCSESIFSFLDRVAES